MFEHPGAVVTERLAQLAVRDDLLIERRVIKAAGTDRRHNETKFQTVRHVLFRAMRAPLEKP